MRSGDGIWRALAAARRDNLAADGIAAPIAGTPGISRRALLASLAGIAAASAFPRPAVAIGRRESVAIIGGGIAGLTALHHLTAAGIDATVYEARKRLGGRMHTVTHADGTRFDRGGQLVNSDHADMHALAARYRIALVDRKDTRHETMIVADGKPVGEARLARLLGPIAAQIDADAALLDGDFARHAPAFDRMSIDDYLDRHAALIGEPWVRRLLEQTARTEYGVEPGAASAIELLFNLPVVDGERVEILGASDERYLIDGGSSALSDALATAHRDRIQTARDLIRIEPNDHRIRLIFRDLSTALADRVIVAVPASIARYIEFAVPIAPDWRAFLGEMALGRNEKVQSAVPTTPWRAVLGRGGEIWHTDSTAAAALGWDGSVPGSTPLFTWFLGGDQVKQTIPIERFAADIAAAIPAMASETTGTVDRSAWARDPYARGAYVNYAPGQLTRFGHLLWLEPDGDALATPPAADRILFAGEHLSDASPGYMNGAAQTGRLAAAVLIGRHIAPDAA